MPSRLSLLLPPVGKREASGGSVIRMGGHQPEDRGSEHVAGNHRQTGASLSTVSMVSVQSGNKHLCMYIQEANLQRVQLEVKTGSELEEVELRVIEMLDQVIADCR